MKYVKTFTNWLNETENLDTKKDEKLVYKAPDQVTMDNFLAAVNEDPDAPLFTAEDTENEVTFFELNDKSRKALDKILDDHKNIKKA